MNRSQEQSINAFIGTLLLSGNIVKKTPDDSEETVQKLVSRLRTLRPLFKELDFSESPPAEEKSLLKGDLIFYKTKNIANILNQQEQCYLALQLMEALGKALKIAAPVWMSEAIVSTELPAIRRNCEAKGIDIEPRAYSVEDRYYLETSTGRRMFTDEADPYLYKLYSSVSELKQGTLSKEEIVYSVLGKLEEWESRLSLFEFSLEEPHGDNPVYKAGDVWFLAFKKIAFAISETCGDNKLALRLLTTVQYLFSGLLPKWQKDIIDNDIATLRTMQVNLDRG